jgi:membrane protein YdbS with pleckstrin-like domain
MVENDYTDTQNLEGLVSSYSNWIEYNYRVNAKNAPLGTLTLLLLIIAVASLSLGVKQALTSTVEWWLLGAVILLLSAVVYLTGLLQQLKRWNRVRQE